jgi:hypothetical protein
MFSCSPAASDWGLWWIDAEAVGNTVRAMAIPTQRQRWHRDLLVFAVLCTLWSAVLMFRVVIRDPFSSQASPFQDVFFGIKFYGLAAHGD